MKKIKLFALAVMAMLGTNAMAQVQSTETFTFTLKGTDATITGFVNGLTAAQMETLTIPATVVDEGGVSRNVVAVQPNGTATKFNGNASIKKVVVAENSNLTTISAKTFEGCSNLTEIDLSNAKKLATLGDNALAGTSIVTLDLSKTKVRVINEFCDAAAVAPNLAWKENSTLTTVVLCDTWTNITAKAFTNCKALKSINFQTANENWIEFDASAAQAITAGAFIGTVLEEIDLSGTLVNEIPAGTFNTVATEYASLKTVKLNSTITALNANFSNCPNLTSIDIQNDAALTALVANEFKFDAKLTSIDLTNITGALANSAFEGAGLTSVTIPAAVTSIGVSTFQDCVALTTVTFNHKAANAFGSTSVKAIGSMAFAGDNKLTAITLPVKIGDMSGAIDDKAFFMCTALKSVTFKPADADKPTTADFFHADAFKNCNDNAAANKLTIYTTTAVAAALTVPDYAKFDTGAAPAANIDGVIFDKAAYAKNSSKYYVKVQTPAGTYIAVKAAAGTKVYEAYLDATLSTMNMIPYMVNNGYYIIGGTAVQNALIITDNANIQYEEPTGTPTSTSVCSQITGLNNAMVILTAATSATTIAAGAPAGQVIYGWVNAASAGTGWMKITSGTMPAKGLYVLAAEPAAGARLNIVWLDENGNVEEETTAIQSLNAEVEAEDDAIYNLAGQKVNAAYKGVVIKNGKKMIQK